MRLAAGAAGTIIEVVKTFDEQKFGDSRVGDKAKPAEKPADVAATGGPLSLGQRVQSLRLPDHAHGRGSTAKLAWFLCLVFAGTTGWLAWQIYGKPAGETDATQTADAASKNSTPTRPTASRQVALESELALESKGYIIPTHQILVSPKVSGVVVELNIEEGQRVAKDTVLARIEDTDYQSDHNRATATLNLARERLSELTSGNRPEEISQAKAELEEAIVQLGKMNLDLQRGKDLFERRVIREGEFEELQSKHQAQQQRVEKLKFALKLMDEGPRQERIRGTGRGESGAGGRRENEVAARQLHDPRQSAARF